MKKILCLLSIILLCFLTGCSLEPEQKEVDQLKAAQDRGKFIVGVSYDTKPFGFLQNGQPAGFDVDIAKYIAKSILGKDNAIEFVETKGYDSISMVASGKVDFLIAATTITPQRQLTVDFSDPYYTTGQAILIAPNAKIVKIKDLNHKKVIVQLNSTAEKTQQTFAPQAITVKYKSHKIAFEEFKAGNGDAIISDEALLKGFVTNNPKFKILPFKLSIEPYGVVIKKMDDNNQLKTEINHALEKMKTDGTLSKLKEKWKI